MAGPEPAAAPTIAIIGGGLTGLLTAQALQKHGFSVKVFEREAHVDARPRDWTILVHWGMPILAELTPPALAARLPDAVTTPHLDFAAEGVETFPVFNGLTGELLMSMPSPGGRRFSRQKLRKILVEGLDVAWCKKVAALDESGNDRVKVTFEDGSTHEADFVVGADGPNSTMRELLVGKEAAQSTSSGLTWTTGITKYGDAAKVQTIIDMHPVAALSFSPAGPAGYGVLDIPDATDMSTWTTFWVRIYKGGRTNIRGQEAIDYTKEITKGLHKPYQDAIDWTPAGSSCYADEMRYWVPSKWESFGGKVTLLGDAAHPMLPYRGQGLQHALTDAKNYAQIMARLRDEKADSAARQVAMAEFDAEVVARGATAVRQSVDEAEKSLDPGMISKMLMMSQGFNKTA